MSPVTGRNQTVREVATVEVTYVIDGRRRPRRSPAERPVREASMVVVDTAVLAAARATVKPDQRLVIVGPNEIDIVNLSNIYARERTARRRRQ